MTYSASVNWCFGGGTVATANLIELAKQNPALVGAYAIPQIVAICGDGNLRDGSECSIQLREYLSRQSPQKLAEYAHSCLEESFQKGGFVLQDVVNEIGRRLGYEVSNGRYQGVSNQTGSDGLWFDGTNSIVVEVKTTDAYRINLDTIRSYAEKIGAAQPDSDFSFLIVVGRRDTGDLEAQVRGSRHAWSTRLISVDALVKMMFIREEVDDKTLIERIRRVLLPFEYTRVDNIVDLVFETQQEIEQKTEGIAELQDAAASREPGVWEFTPRQELEEKRSQVVAAFFADRNEQAIKLSRTNFATEARSLGVTCAVSKRYRRDSQPYWYALHPQWLAFLRSLKEAYFVLGCMDRDEAYALPLTLIEQHLDDLNTTETKSGQGRYWHIALANDNGRLALNISSIGKKIDLEPYAFKLSL